MASGLRRVTSSRLAVISVVVTSPRFQPASANSEYNVFKFRPSGRTFTAPLTIREPQPQLEDAAEESVTIEFKDRMFIHAT